MNPLARLVRRQFPQHLNPAATSLLLLLCVYLTAGCGGGSTIPVTPPPPPPAPTAVTVVLTSTANDQLTSFYVDITSITFKDEVGEPITVLAAPQGQAFAQTYMAEFLHLNGQLAPLLQTSLDSDVIVSATLTYTYAAFAHSGLNSSQALETDLDASGGPTAVTQTATVDLPKPITIQGSAMALALDLQVSSSGTFVTHTTGDTASITPTFTLTPVTPASQVQMTGVAGTITAVNSASNSMTLLVDYGFNNETYPDGASFEVATSPGTVYQGIGNFSALAAGTFANVDLAIHSDGSLVATRIEVQDLAATNVLTGLVGSVYGPPGRMNVLSRINEEFNQDNTPGGTVGVYGFDGTTVFQVSGQLGANALTNLPFAANFDISSMAAGQNIAVGSEVIVTSGGNFTHATTITLEPQTINGTVTGISSSGGFTVYQVTLAAYDLFPVLSTVVNQSTVLQNASIVEVYVGSDTKMLNSKTIATGDVLRFHGLVFDDAGAARMVCLRINDGVTL